MRKAVVYARVSTDEQAEHGYSLPTQLEACRRYADVHGFEVVSEYQDDMSGGTPITARPGGAKVQALVAAHAVDAVIVYQVDRLYRDTVELLITTRAWLRGGVELHFCDIGKVKTENDILLVIGGWAGTNERTKIIERMARGKNGKAAAGFVVASGTTPYGYDFTDGTLAPNADARIVRMIFDWYVRGADGKPLTLHEICKRLESMGIETPGAGVYNRKAPSTSWNPTTISRMLSREAYAGRWVWGKTRQHNKVRDFHPEEPAIGVDVPAIVDRATWDAAQKRKEYNKRHAKRNAQHEYILSGRVRCECGRAMAGFHKRGALGYRCTSATAALVDLQGERRCTTGQVKADLLESVVWDHITAIVTDQGYFYDLLKEAQRVELDALEPKRARLADVDALLAACTRDVADLALALTKARGAVGDVLQQQMDQVNERYDRLAQERATVQADIDRGTLTDAQIAALMAAFAGDMLEGLDNATAEDKRRIYDELGLEVVITHDHHARVTCRLPLPEASFDLRSSRRVPRNRAISALFDLVACAVRKNSIALHLDDRRANSGHVKRHCRSEGPSA